MANLLAFYQLQMLLLLQLLLKLQEQEAEIIVNLQEICNLKKKTTANKKVSGWPNHASKVHIFLRV